MTTLSGLSIGRYHILEQIGEGGMAVVYKAFDTKLEQDVAIKFIRSDKFSRESAEITGKRFQREAHLLSKLSHPNILTLLDYGEHEGHLYLVTNFIPGGSLKARLGKPMPWHEAVRLLLPIVRALEYAHSKNILHRDIKPSNILLPPNGPPILADFGIAKVLESGTKSDATQSTQTDRGEATQTDSPQLTRSDVGIGTPEYMAPEQGRGKADKRSDIYSLGIVLYELVTGRKPFVADTPLAILLMHITDPLPLPRKFAPDLPIEMERIIIQALAKKPEDRYQTMAAFAAALEQRAKFYEEQIRARAVRFEKEEDWTGAQEAWREVLALTPADRQQVEARIERIQATNTLDKLYLEGKSALAQKVYERAAKSLRQVVAQDRKYKDAAALLAHAVKMRQSRALQLEKNGKWDDAVEVWHGIMAAEPEDRPIIEAEIERIQRLRELSGLYNEAKQALAKKDDAQATKLLKAIITRDETYKDALELLMRVAAKRSTMQKQIRRKRTWAVLGVTAVMLILLVVAVSLNPTLPGSMLVSLRAWVFGQDTSTTPSKTAYPAPGAGTAGITAATPAGTEVATNIATPTELTMSTSAVKISDFADPILAAIADMPPDYQDDFSDPSSGWPSGSTSDGTLWAYSGGVYFASVTPEYRNANNDPCLDVWLDERNLFPDAVLEVEAQILSGESGNWHLGIYGTDLGFYPNGEFAFIKDGIDIGHGESPYFKPKPGKNHLTIIAFGNQIAFYINGLINLQKG